MKKTLICLIMALLTVFACTRDEKPTTMVYEFSDIKEVVGINSCTITCRNESVDDETIHARVLLSKNENFENVAAYAIHVSGDSLCCIMSDLDRNTLYFYRFEMYTNYESLQIDGIHQFKTLQGGGITVTTSDVINITRTTATGGGSVSIDGDFTITERGICWSTHHNPNNLYDSHAANGEGIGSYAVNMTGLVPDSIYYVRAYAKHNNGVVYGNEVSFVTQNANLPTVLTQEVSNITRTSALASGNVTDDGGLDVTERGVCWSTAHSPNIEGSHANNGTGTGAFSIEIGELVPNTTYYVRAYAQNAKGVAYGDEVEFKTAEDVSSPLVNTLPVTNITSTTATGGGNVTNDGGATVTERGICWSTSHNPTTNDEHTSNGTGLGEFSVVMADLEPGTTYYVRAYAENSQGVSYGVEVSFITVANPPTVTTGEVSNITQTTALGSGTVTDDGGLEITERGLCWSTNHTPTLNNNHASNGVGTGGFTVEMTGLTSNTTYYVRAYAINSQGTAYGNEVEFKTSQNVSAPKVTTSEVINITQTTAKGGGNVTNDGGATVTERGICWSTEHNPTTSNSHANSGTGTGEFTCNMSGLTAGTTYYVRAYAKNSEGTSYGAEVSFITEPAITLPTVTTAQVSNITQTTATGGGNVTATGNATVTERGICWSTSHNPTTSGSHASNGGGTGTYSVNMTGLTPNTTYYVRAYATNSAGTAYGAEVSFTTLQNVSLPTVTTSQVTNITQTTATGGGNVTSAGGATVTERGICWSTSHNPTTSHTHASSGTGTGTYTVSMSNLTANTTYYVRAYAINSAGTAYGSEVSFTTASIPTYTISVSANPTNGGTVNGGGTYQQGQSCTVTATAATGYTFLRWTENGNQVSTNASYTFSVTNNRTLVAQFQAQSYTISISASPSNGGSVSGGGSFYYGQSCTVTATANNDYSFTNWTENGSQVSTNSSYTFTVNGNRTLVANFIAVPSWPNGVLPGAFSVSETQQVHFSQGNLQFQASTNTWRFASHQYEYIGNSNSNISQTYSGWIDMFGWGTSGYNHGAVCYQPWSTSQNSYEYFAYGDETLNLFDQTGQADWGYNAISNGGNQTGLWRTLTYGEWYVLLNTRSTPSGIRYAKAVVNGINGVILLPDNWNTSNYTLNNTNTSEASYSSNTISNTQWSTLEQYGAVFLPASGHRFGASPLLVGNSGYYWTANPAGPMIGVGNATSMYFKDNLLSHGSAFGRSHGNSVRLVQDY